MDQLIEIIRRLVLAAVWLTTIVFAGMFAFLAISEGRLSIILVSLGIIFLGWVTTKLFNWIFLR